MAAIGNVSPQLGAGPLQAELARLEQDALRLASGLPEPGSEPATPGFAHSMAEALRGIDARDQAAGARMTAVENGESDDLVGAMLASQQASLSFSMLMQVRNKVVGAVDELIKLQL
ncbi:flagellar hook-basal body complex protein FliE [Roseateles sp. DAIF2]|uniref:flagellar hook-basal body complex protein FliE n=1 Tax=Roseateles sp. DAIF2 TaxID=2714952 RepID=UPI0018A2F660|nr:flagellar hook-basal body complex protein FliE [Roseateles sp. DAIF2]QPF74172.1 flagellar hook-basal body complex protein FliE [Roseateles sp. DAIF2]